MFIAAAGLSSRVDFLFVSVAVIIISHTLALCTARSVSSEKDSAKKALKTVLLHLIQLGLCLTSFLYIIINKALYMVIESSSLFINLRYFNFLIVIILPRCLINGMRDKPVLRLCSSLLFPVVQESKTLC